MKCVQSSCDVGEVTTEAGTHDIFTLTESDIDGAIDSIIGINCITCHIHHSRDSVTARSKVGAEQFDTRGIAQREVIECTMCLLPRIVVNLIAESVVADGVITHIGNTGIHNRCVARTEDAGSGTRTCGIVVPSKGGIVVGHAANLNVDNPFWALTSDGFQEPDEQVGTVAAAGARSLSRLVGVGVLLGDDGVGLGSVCGRGCIVDTSSAQGAGDFNDDGRSAVPDKG